MSLFMLPLCLFFFSADCPNPHFRENMVPTNTALLMNEFLEDSEVTLECRNGYVLESGSGIMTCVDGNWTEPDLVCKSESCLLYL